MALSPAPRRARKKILHLEDVSRGSISTELKCSLQAFGTGLLEIKYNAGWEAKSSRTRWNMTIAVNGGYVGQYVFTRIFIQQESDGAL